MCGVSECGGRESFSQGISERQKFRAIFRKHILLETYVRLPCQSRNCWNFVGFGRNGYCVFKVEETGLITVEEGAVKLFVELVMSSLKGRFLAEFHIFASESTTSLWNY